MPDGTIQLRNATPADAQAISSLLADLGHNTPSSEIPARLEAVRKAGGVVLVAVDERDHPVGLMSLAKHVTIHAPRPIAYITALVTSSATRRRGVGQLLVAAAKEWAIAHECVRLSVTSAERRSDAHAFYPACGLPYTGRRFAMEIPGKR
jgi:GNAT superfamily N-acetyltransferase